MQSFEPSALEFSLAITKISLHPKHEGYIFRTKLLQQNSFFVKLLNYFDKNFITYIVILYNHNLCIEIKKLALELCFKASFSHIYYI